MATLLLHAPDQPVTVIAAGAAVATTGAVLTIPPVNRRFGAGIQSLSRWANGGRPQPPDLANEHKTVTADQRTYGLSLTTFPKRRLEVTLWREEAGPQASYPSIAVAAGVVSHVSKPELAEWYKAGFNAVTVRYHAPIARGKMDTFEWVEKTYDLRKMHKNGELTSPAPTAASASSTPASK
jgi:hypothetical protein